MIHTPTHKEIHTGTTMNRLNWLRASVLGANDGIISVAALMVGVAGASATPETLLITGVAGLIAGALSMMVGEYVSVSSQRDSERVLLDKERYELEHYAELEFKELVSIYEQKGVSPETAQKVARELTDHDVFAAHVDVELGIDPNNLTNPWHAGIASAIAYSVGALIPLVAIVLPPESIRIPVTFAAVLVALIITGVLAARVSGASAKHTTLRVVIGGIIAMVVTFGIGKLFDVAIS